MVSITDQQAYAAMFYFLDKIYQRTKSDELGGLLGSMSMLEDGSTADPAILRGWQEAIEYVVHGGLSGKLDIR